LPLDTLREYQTELILATQSIYNLREGLDSKKVKAYLANLVYKIYLTVKI
jgi:type IV secretory pathway TraG/TraD family ATPase VirD4